MCILLYNICSKCYFGYPRFTECCPYMHPPLIYCPQSTQFKFRIVGETECYLHPHHAPLLHIGGDGNDTVLSVHPSGSGPVIESISQIPFEATDAGTRVDGSNTAQPMETSTGRQTSFQTVNEIGHTENERPGQQGGYHEAKRTNSYTPSTAYAGKANAPYWDQGQKTFNNRARRRSNYTINPKNTPHTSTYYGYHTNRLHSRAPFDFKYRAEGGPQYKYYPHQATPMAPFYGGSGSTPPGCAYLPVYSPSRQSSYGGGGPPGSFRVGSNQTVSEYMSGGSTGTAYKNWDTNRKSSFNPQASAFQNSASQKELQELRRNNLEQLQQSNDAAYYNLNGHGGSRSVASNDSDVNTETSSRFAYQTHADRFIANDAYRYKRQGEKSHSWSEFQPRQTYMGDSTPSPAFEERRTLSHHGDPQPHNTDKGKEVLYTSPSSWVQSPLPGSPVQDAAPTDVNNVPVETESSVTVKQESDDEDSKLENGANWSPVSVKTDPETEVKLRDIPLASLASQTLEQIRSEDSKSDNGDRHSDLDTRASAKTSKAPKLKALNIAPALSPAQKSGPSTWTPNPRSWSAVVSGKYVPSSGSFPVQATAPTPNKQPIITTNKPSEDETLPKTQAGVSQENPSAPSSETSGSDAHSGPPRPPQNSPATSVTKPAYRPERPNSAWGHRFPRDSSLGPDVASPISGNVSVVSDDSMAATEATAPTTVSEAASSQAPRPSPAIQVTQLASPVAPSSPRQSIEPIQVSKARPMAGAPTPTALEPVVPKPRLWSQVLGGSNVKSFSLKTKSDGDKDESKWPSLGAKGSKNGSTRNKSS